MLNKTSTFFTLFYVQRIVKMNKTEDDELGDEELSDEEIRGLSEGLCLECIF